MLPFGYLHYIAVGSLLLLSIIGYFLQKHVYKRLSSRHLSTFTQLGSPSFMRAAWRSRFKMQGFIYLRKHSMLHDRRLTLLCDGIIIIRVLSVLIFIFLVVSIYNLYVNGDFDFLFD